jgi:general secretion pathway protein L
MASTLYLLLSSKSSLGFDGDLALVDYRFALVSQERKIVQQGKQSLSELKPLLASAAKVVLLLAPTDVNVLHVATPPMPLAKLRQSLPNLIEEHIFVDPSELSLSCSPVHDGKSRVYLVDRLWLQQIYELFAPLVPKKLSAYALFDSLAVVDTPDAIDSAVVLLEETPTGMDLTFRTAQSIGSGLSFDGLYGTQNGSQHGAHTQAMQALQLLLPEGKVHLFVSESLQDTLMPLLQTDETLFSRLQFLRNDWLHKTSGLDKQSVDLLRSLTEANNHQIDWARWRMPIYMSSLLVFLVILGVNIEAWKMQKEAKNLRNSLTQVYKNSFPNEAINREPLLLMQQKIDQSRKFSGQSSYDDFLVLAGQFGQVWEQMSQSQAGLPELEVLEYKERSLFIKVKGGAVLPKDSLGIALQQYSLLIEDAKDGQLKIMAQKGMTP